jgi:transcriptional regulator with XRE-family HTH domain
MARDQRYEKFQKALVEARLKSNLTQQEVALRLEKPQSFISKYESGERRLDVIEFLDVCEALRITPVSILKTIGSDND